MLMYQCKELFELTNERYFCSPIGYYSTTGGAQYNLCCISQHKGLGLRLGSTGFQTRTDSAHVITNTKQPIPLAIFPNVNKVR